MARQRFSVTTIILTGGAVLLVVPALVAGTIYTGALQKRAEELTVENLRVRGELSANLLGRRLHQLWQEISSLSHAVPDKTVAEVRRQIDTISELDKRYSWIGVANVEGKVLAATNGLLEGIAVDQRPWFRRGLEGPAAVDVHEAVLLAKLLPATSEPWRFIDFSAPIRDADGTVKGVVGAHLDWRWVADNVRSLQAPGIDVILISRDGTVLLGPEDLVGKGLTVGSALAASRTEHSVLDERWPDGKDYVTVSVPGIGHEDLPSFGWSLLVRQDVQTALQPTRELVRSFWSILGAGAVVALLLLASLARFIATPLRRLASSAEAMQDRADLEPLHEETRYDEAARLSDALTRTQSALLSARLRQIAHTTSEPREGVSAVTALRRTN